MGATLAAAVRARPEAEGWLVALGDMPWIEPQTIEAVARPLDGGTPLVAPSSGPARASGGFRRDTSRALAEHSTAMRAHAPC